MKNIVGNQYAKLPVDPVSFSKSNHNLEQQKAICQFMITKYCMREKGQDTHDCIKIDYYNEWLKEIVKNEENQQFNQNKTQ